MKMILNDGTSFDIVRFVKSRAIADGVVDGFVTVKNDQDVDALAAALTTENMSKITFTSETGTITEKFTKVANFQENLDDRAHEITVNLQ